MKTLFATLSFFCLTILSFSQDKGVTISVTIDNVTSDDGLVLFGLHNQETFMKSKGLQSKASTIKDGKVNIEFENVTPGTYAIMVLHDENNNKRMDFQSNGMPKENYAMSNNPMSYGPPRFEDAQFEVQNEDLNLNIRF